MHSDNSTPSIVSRPAPLVIAFSDVNYLPLLQLWVQNIGRLGVRRMKIFCLDVGAYAWCEAHGIPCAQIKWGGELRDLWVQRIRIFSELLASGQDFIHSDIDALWIKNPFEHGSARHCTEDLVFSSGTVWPSDVHDQWGFVLCCGWFRARPSAATQRFFQTLETDVLRTGDDQISVNRLLAAAGASWQHGGRGDYQLAFRDRKVQCWSEPIRAEAGQLSVALLPQLEFQRLPQDSDQAIVKHFLTPKNCSQKISALRGFGLI